MNGRFDMGITIISKIGLVMFSALILSIIACGCSNEINVVENGIIKCNCYYSGEYKFDSINTKEQTNGFKEVVITLKRVEKHN